MSSSPVIDQTIPRPAQPRPIVSLGAGGIVHDAHYPAYAKAGYPVFGLYDPDRARAAFMADAFQVPRVFASQADAAAQAPADAVFDVAVPAAHIPDVIEALPDGAPVLIQKPLGDNLAQARRIREICRRKGLVAAVNFQMRWAPFVLAARRLIQQGVIGDVADMEIRVNVFTPWRLWPFLENVPHAEVLYHSIHHIDLARSFLGEPQGVWAQTTAHPDAPRQSSSRSTVICRYDPMLRVNIETNHFHKYGWQHQEAYVKWEGTRGAIKATMGILMDYPQGQPDALAYCALEEGTTPAWQAVALEGAWFPDAFIGSMGSLMRYLDGEAQDLPTAVADAFKTMAVADAACRSSDHGGQRVYPA